MFSQRNWLSEQSLMTSACKRSGSMLFVQHELLEPFCFLIQHLTPRKMRMTKMMIRRCTCMNTRYGGYYSNGVRRRFGYNARCSMSRIFTHTFCLKKHVVNSMWIRVNMFHTWSTIWEQRHRHRHQVTTFALLESFLKTPNHRCQACPEGGVGCRKWRPKSRKAWRSCGGLGLK